MVQAVYDTAKHRSNESQAEIYNDICMSMMVFSKAFATTLDGSDNIKPPKNFEEAMKLDNWDDWCYVTLKELEGMDKMGVFSKEEYTMDDLERMGIKHAPMPVGLIYDIKRDTIAI